MASRAIVLRQPSPALVQAQRSARMKGVGGRGREKVGEREGERERETERERERERKGERENLNNNSREIGN